MNLQDIGRMLALRSQGTVPMNGGLENIQTAQSDNVPAPTGSAGRAGNIIQDRMEWRDYYTNFQPTRVEPEPLQFEPWLARKYGPGATTNPYKPR
jgi:hypothetical protein